MIMIINRVSGRRQREPNIPRSGSSIVVVVVVVEKKIESIPPKRGQSFLRGRRHWLYGKYERRATTAHERERERENMGDKRQ